MIYYGDKIGMPGAGDPDNRRFMQWDAYTQNQTWLRDQLSALAKIRAAHPSTRRGTRTTIGVANDVFVYKMATSGDAIYVALNRGDTDQPAVNLASGTYKDLVTGELRTVPLTIPARTGLVLVAQ